MGDLNNDVTWPPSPIRTERLTLRATQADDRAAFIDLLISPTVRQYLGGPLQRDQVERDAPEIPGNRPGVFAIAGDSGLIGSVTLDRRDHDRPGHLRPEGGELEVSYSLLPDFWGQGLPFEAVDAALGWAADALPDRDVILCTQVENRRSRRLAERLGFVEVTRFRAHHAEQWLGRRALTG